MTTVMMMLTDRAPMLLATGMEVVSWSRRMARSLASFSLSSAPPSSSAPSPLLLSAPSPLLSSALSSWWRRHRQLQNQISSKTTSMNSEYYRWGQRSTRRENLSSSPSPRRKPPETEKLKLTKFKIEINVHYHHGENCFNWFNKSELQNLIL